MKGFKLIKTTFANTKDIVGVTFNGVDDFNLFVEADGGNYETLYDLQFSVRKTYNLEAESEIAVYSQDFVVKQEIFSDFIVQFIASPDFVLDIKLSSQTALSVLTPTESEVDLNEPASIALDSQTIITEPIVRTISCLGETEFINFRDENAIFVQTNILQQLPTTEDIRNIDDVHLSLTSYQNGTLENRERINIAKAVICHVLKQNKSKILTTDDFLQLAQSIVDIFPFEVKKTYYVPFRRGHLAKGKLYDAYNNYRSRLSAAGVINRRIKSKSQDNQIASVNQGNLNIPEHTTANEETNITTDLQILQSGSAEWQIILAKWKSTHVFRHKELENQNFTTLECFEKYAVLSNEKSHELFEIDFKILYPSSKSISDWKSFYCQVITKAEKLKDKCVKEILANIESAEDEDSKLALTLMIIPYLLPSSRRSSKLEVQRSFIQYCQNILEADDETREEIKRLKIESQPKIYLIGDSHKTVCLAYVDISGHRLKFENPLKAIEVCFHCFMGMNIKYPSRCAHVWMFIQKLVFKINTPWDTIIPSINTLINDLQSAK